MRTLRFIRPTATFTKSVNRNLIVFSKTRFLYSPGTEKKKSEIFVVQYGSSERKYLCLTFLNNITMKILRYLVYRVQIYYFISSINFINNGCKSMVSRKYFNYTVTVPSNSGSITGIVGIY